MRLKASITGYFQNRTKQESGCRGDCIFLTNRIPFDSDLTIREISETCLNSAFCTISHLLRDTSETIGFSGAMSKEVWDFVFLQGEYPKHCGIAIDSLERLRNEFEYWNGVDLKVSRNEYLLDHILFYIYHHCGIWKNVIYLPFVTSSPTTFQERLKSMETCLQTLRE